VVGIIVVFGDLLRLEKTFLDLRQELVVLAEEVVNGIHAGCAYRVG
jgi:hypothetical protein